MHINHFMINAYNNNVYIYSTEYIHTLRTLMSQFDIDNNQIINDHYLFNKFVSLCIKKGKSKIAYRNVLNSFLLIKQYFKINAFILLKIAIKQIEPFIILRKIGKKERIYPRILPIKTRINNALYIIVKQALKNSKTYKYFYISLANSIIENSIISEENIYNIKNKQDIEIAEMNKRSIKFNKRGSKKIIGKIRRKERFKLFKKIKIWK